MDKQQVIDIVKDVINYQLVDYWAYIILFICTIAGSYIGARVKKSAENSAINSNFENILSQQKQLAKDIGSIKSELDRGNIKYQIKLSDYNAKSLDSIELVYDRLVKIKLISREIQYTQTPELAKQLVDSIQDFRITFDVKRIWIPLDLSKDIENIAIELGNKATGFAHISRTAQMSNNLTSAQIDKIYEKQDKFYDYMSQELDNTFNDLVKRISSSTVE